MISTKLTLADFVVGHSWSGIPAVIVTHAPGGGVAGPPAYDLTKVEMVWRKIGNIADDFTLSSAGASPKITITSAANWEFSIPKTILPLATAGRWEWLISGYGETADEKDPLLSGVITVHAAP